MKFLSFYLLLPCPSGCIIKVSITSAKGVREFLSGLKEDLKNDIREMAQDKAIYLESKTAFAYLAGFSKGETIQKDSLKLYGRGSLQFLSSNWGKL